MFNRRKISLNLAYTFFPSRGVGKVAIVPLNKAVGSTSYLISSNNRGRSNTILITAKVSISPLGDLVSVSGMFYRCCYVINTS